MKNKLLLSFALLLSVSLGWAQPDFSLIGYAAMEGEGNFYQKGGTTGGEGGAVVTPTTFSELKQYVEDASTPYIILITKEFTTDTPCTVDNEGHIAASGTASTYGEILKVGSNKTLLGVGDAAFFNRIGLVIQTQSNIIIRNIKFTMKNVPVVKSGENKVLAWRNGAEVTLGDPDCISIQADITSASKDYGHHYWIDHCEFFNENGVGKDRYDGLLDMKNNVQYTTISWCKFHEHSKACLSGKGNSDKYPRTVTMHHNYFYNIQGSRLPLQRGGTYHYYNNYQEECQDGYDLRAGAIAYIEGCYFKNVKAPVMPSGEGEGATLTDLIFDGCRRIPEGFTDLVTTKFDETYNIPTSSYRPPYSYQADPASDVPTIVPQYCGVGKIENFNDGAPKVVIHTPTAGQVITYEEGLKVNVSFSVTDEDGTIQSVKLLLDQQEQAVANAGTDYTAELAGLAKGIHTLVVEATDNENNTASRSVTFSVQDYEAMAVTTLPASDVTSSSAILNALFAANSDVILSKGFIYGKDAALSEGTEIETNLDSYTLKSLDESATYYFRAFAKKEGQTVYGEILSFTTAEHVDAPAGTVLVQIGAELPDGYEVDFSMTPYEYSTATKDAKLILLNAGEYSITVPAHLQVTSIRVTACNDNNTAGKGTISIAGRTETLGSRKEALNSFTVDNLALSGSISFEVTYKAGVKFELVTASPTSLSDGTPMNKKIIATEYYNLNGMKMQTPVEGICIVRKAYEDGTVEAEKVLIK